MKKMIFLASLLVFLCSCSFFTSTVGDGTTYQYGTLSGLLQIPIAKADDTTVKAIKEMKLVLTSHTEDAVYSVFNARNAQNRNVVINLTRMTNETSKITIKVGWSGDMTFSQILFDTIKGK